MNIIYCNVGEMKFYNGIANDILLGGGSFNNQNIGLEVNNYTNHNGIYFGYVQASSNTIDISKNFGYPNDAKYADEITVVWIANHKIVGYYKDAKVYRKPLSVPLKYAIERDYGEKSVYNISSNNVVLIPVEKRSFEIVGNGRSNVWYGNEIINKEVLEYIESYENGLVVADIDDIIRPLKKYEIDSVVKIRLNQGKFRNELMTKYNRKCCLCGADFDSVLIASHIKPWAESKDEEKLSRYNGLLLCPNHDKLFDLGYISFDENGKIIISDKLTKENRKLFCIDESMQLKLSDESQHFMKYHRENKFKK